jgi:hypothetical protein
MLKAWMSKYVQERWANRLKEREVQQGDLLVVKTVFNPVWEHVKIADIHQTILDEWSKDLAPEQHASNQLTLWDVGVSRVSNPPAMRRSRKRKVARMVGSTYVAEVVSEPEYSEEDDGDRFRGRRPLLNGPAPLEIEHAGVSSDGVDQVAQIMKSRMILSRKRNLTLGDLVATWRKTTLGYSEAPVFGPDVLRQL